MTPAEKRETILTLRTGKGGWTRKTLEALGVSWPPKQGWLDEKSRSVTEEQLKAAVALVGPAENQVVGYTHFLYNPRHLSPEQLSTVDRVIVHSDGSGWKVGEGGGWAAILRYKELVKEISGGVCNTTTNRMEILAICKALEHLNRPCHVLVYSDSQVAISAFRSPSRPSNADLRERAVRAIYRHKSVEIKWVRGHEGNEDNERADVLAGEARLNVQTHVFDPDFDTRNLSKKHFDNPAQLAML